MRGDWKLALLVVFPVWFIAAGCVWFATIGRSYVQPGSGSTANPTIVFGVFAVVFVALGIWGWRFMMMTPAQGGKFFLGIWASQPHKPADVERAMQTTGRQAAQPVNSPQPVRTWVGRSGIWIEVLFIALGLGIAGVLVWAGFQTLASGLSLGVVAGVAALWIMAIYMAWLFWYALTFVAPITLRMDAVGVRIRRLGQPTHSLAWEDIAGLGWLNPVPAGAVGTPAGPVRMENQGGLYIRPKTTKAANGRQLSEAEVDTEWTIGSFQFSNRQWTQIKADLAQAVTANGGDVLL